MSQPTIRLSLEELGLFNTLAGIEKGEDVDPFLLQGLLARGFIVLATPAVLTPAGATMLRKLAERLEAESLGDTSVRAQRASLDPRTTREIPTIR